MDSLCSFSELLCMPKTDLVELLFEDELVLSSATVLDHTWILMDFVQMYPKIVLRIE